MENSIDNKPAITTTGISRRIGINISAKFITEVLGIPPKLKTANSNYWLEDDFKRICYELSQHFYGLQFAKYPPKQICQCEFTVRTSNCLRSAGIDTVNHLLNCTKHDLLVIPNFGKTCLKEIELFLSEYDLKLEG